jgi:hypothetical protein
MRDRKNKMILGLGKRNYQILYELSPTKYDSF